MQITAQKDTGEGIINTIIYAKFLETLGLLFIYAYDKTQHKQLKKKAANKWILRNTLYGR